MIVETPSDQTVWHDLLTGDARQFGLIWDRHRDRVLRHLLASGVPSAEAEDLTATVFLELWRRREAARFVEGSLLPWLIVTAQNVARNSLRARRRYRAFLAKLPPPAPAEDPADEVAQRHGSTAPFRKILAAARPADRRLLALTAMEGFTTKQAAAMLGLSESAAKMRLARLRPRLRAAWTDDSARHDIE